GISFSASRHAHLRHHWYNRTEKDPDAYNVGAPSPGLIAQYYLVIVAGLPLATLHFNVLYPLVWYRRRELPRHVAELAVLGVTYWFVFSQVLAPRGLTSLALQVWLIPLLFA